MLRSIKSVLFSILFFAVLTSCEKEVSLENGIDETGGTQSGTAEFTLNGAPLTCTTPLISGDYVVGTALDISNTVVVTVNVTTPGTYVIATGLINGIRFSGSGTFATAGSEVITLFGTGTPVAALTAPYIPGTSGCSFLITATAATVTPLAPVYYEATIDGTAYSVHVDGTNSYGAGSEVSGTTDDKTLSSYIRPVAMPRPAGTTSFTLSKGVIHNYSTLSNVTFKAFFSNTFNYTDLGNDGITILWGDEANVDWTTDSGSGDQTGSAFTITSVVDEPGQANYTVRVTATFNCKLYDGLGNSKTLTNGKYFGVFSKL